MDIYLPFIHTTWFKVCSFKIQSLFVGFLVCLLVGWFSRLFVCLFVCCLLARNSDSVPVWSLFVQSFNLVIRNLVIRNS